LTLSDLAWDPPLFDGGGLVYDVLRSDQKDDFSLASCVPPNDTSNTTATDATPPAPVLFYLIRAQSVCGGEHLGLKTDPPVRRTGVACD
jgi:hypothetical protein